MVAFASRLHNVRGVIKLQDLKKPVKRRWIELYLAEREREVWVRVMTRMSESQAAILKSNFRQAVVQKY